MNRLSSVFLFFIFFVYACGGEKNAKNETEFMTVIEESGPMPDWIKEGIKISEDENRQKNILMVCYGKGARKDVAQKFSALHCATYVPSYFHEIILREFENMMAEANINPSEQNRFKSTEILTGKINVSGMIPLKSWWRNVSKSSADPAKQPGTYFEFYSLYSLPYSRFVQIIEEVKQQTVIKKDGNKLSPEQIELLNRKLDQLKADGEKLLTANLILGEKE